MKRVLVLRPEPGASATVKRAKERGLDALAIPLFEVRPVDWDVPDAGSFDGLLLTSANAVRHSGEQLKELRGLPVHAVGAATAAAAREAGFDVTSSGEAGVERLLGSLEPDLKLLHLAGEDRRTVDNARQEICTITVYRSKARDGVAVRDVDGSIALLHSPRAGKRFAELAESAVKSSISIAAISEEAADAAGDGWATVEAADTPTDEALLALAERLCNNPAPK
jgi:uroporphyrinogen-III synthase